jgi:hypothetical protein
LAFGVKVRLVYPEVDTAAPIVPNDECVSKFPYSVA